ncbi:hypothetical protein HGO53_05625 [Wolbachia endosymbiont of Diaphorina citri]|uniref:hypothetical protein n=1 Tax=Wolbachia endosymbiont of Diaphorina citri TaxID=116598 RepID=UPI00135974FA|nr:hypothetical protein [Wolbachia endosymbiont of Diaphorina citri]QJT94710.1 hypothetical protein HGO48_04915 [Wolbachia endosymbiont of Diaphorina citri]QJT95949.1 hypothetical protein HGO49_04915 [Wolbachia endosymbiont of Diaphorina citri]QJT97310.1 hypothetical protein HGO53_05625 [Wolbachia endosymbiont of Diaphorina citri]QLK11606.1 hypothetical protein FK497_04975 [Wolbachia endosymbiont of Diaphorina citri]QXY86860.1 hypothetical protein GZ064_02630 [Wolbachia endosymbiont of Diaphor
MSSTGMTRREHWDNKEGTGMTSSFFLDPSSHGTAFVFEAKPAITFNTLLSQTNVRTVV